MLNTRVVVAIRKHTAL